MYDSKVAKLWDRENEPRFPGDVRSRPAALELLNAQRGELVLDAGCGTGTLSRAIARTGALVYGCDRSSSMLEIARHHEQERLLGIEYCHLDISNIEQMYGSRNLIFDKVFCCAVLIHADLCLIESFLSQAQDLLKPGGVLVISVTHPFAYLPFSPARNGLLPWQRFEPKDPRGSYLGAQQYTEYYMDRDGQVFECDVWGYSIECYLNRLIGNGFQILNLQEILWEESDALISPHWTGPIGFPEWLQIRAIKTP